VAGRSSGETGDGASRGVGDDNSPVCKDGSANNSPELSGGMSVGPNNSLVGNPAWLFDGGGGGVSSSGSSMRGGASS